MSEELVGRLAERVKQADLVRAELSLAEWDDGWCYSRSSGVVASSQVPVGALENLATLGCRVEVRIEEGTLRVAGGCPEFRGTSVAAR
jgi:hypothetical protein